MGIKSLKHDNMSDLLWIVRKQFLKANFVNNDFLWRAKTYFTYTIQDLQNTLFFTHPYAAKKRALYTLCSVRGSVNLKGHCPQFHNLFFILSKVEDTWQICFLFNWVVKIDFLQNSNFSGTILKNCIFHVVLFQLKYFKYKKSSKLYFNKNELSPYVAISKVWQQIVNFKGNFNENIWNKIANLYHDIIEYNNYNLYWIK